MFVEFRSDGWPLCPICGEDELHSRLHWNGQGDQPILQAYIDAGMGCYRCGWHSDEGLSSKPAPDSVDRMLMQIDLNAALAAVEPVAEGALPCAVGKHQWEKIVEPDKDADGKVIPGGYPGWSVCLICGARRMNDLLGGGN